MDQDLAIIHISDLHFPTGGLDPGWVKIFLDSISELAENANLKLFSIAVTGDLVNSPDKMAFNAVKRFLEATSVKAGIERNGQADWSRIWVVDGNHDWRLSGIFRTEGGIEEIGGINRLSKPFLDDDGRFFVFGVNSSKQGEVARGRVSFEELRQLRLSIRDKIAQASLTNAYRIGLLHHHLLPLPDSYNWEDTSFARKFDQIINEESFKLLGNAGLVTSVLVENEINLVLHGHEHKPFFARVRHLNYESQKYTLCVAGAPAAKSGFHVIRFHSSGDVDLVPYTVDKAEYKQQRPIVLWEYEEWRAWLWERASKEQGSYGKMARKVYITPTGDMISNTTIREIKAGHKKRITEIPISSLSHSPNLGTACIVKVLDIERDQDVPITDLPKPAAEVIYRFQLIPPATDEQTHSGLNSEQISVNEYAMTGEDARLRNIGNSPQKYAFWMRLPTKEFLLSINFPYELAPKHIELTVTKQGGQIKAETQRAQSQVFYDPRVGVCVINLKFILPNEMYEIAWTPPEVDFNSSRYEFDRAAAPYYDYLLRQIPNDPTTPVNTILRSFKDELLDTGLKDSIPFAEAFELGLVMFVENEKQIRPIGGTYDANSPLWSFKLNWGVGIAGASMRRGKPVFYIDDPGKSSELYKKCENCPPDKYMLAIPFALPPGVDLPAYPGAYRVAMVLHSVSNSSGLGSLRDLNAREQVAQLAQDAFNRCVKGSRH